MVTTASATHIATKNSIKGDAWQRDLQLELHDRQRISLASYQAILSVGIRLEVMYLPSSSATANAVHHDRDLHFRGHEF